MSNELKNSKRNGKKISDSQLNDENNLLILTIDIGNNKIEKLYLKDLNNPEKDIYNFCMENKLNYESLNEIKNQISNVLNDNNLKNLNSNNINIIKNIKTNKNSNSKKSNNNNNFSFNPKINKNSQKIISNTNKNFFQRIDDYNKLYNNHLKELKNENEKKNVFSFMPKTNIKKLKVNNNYYNKLYYDDNSKRDQNYQQLKKNFTEKFSFKPKLNNNFNKSNINDEFYKRLKDDEIKRKDNKKKLSDLVDEEIDLIKKPNLFENKFYRNKKRINSLDYCNRMYNYNNKYKENKKKLENTYYNNLFKSEKNKNSENIIKKRNLNNFKMVFKILDSDLDGIISYKKINTKIPDNLNNIIYPFIDYVKSVEDEINEIDFLIIFEEFYNKLNYKEKNEFNNLFKNDNNRQKYNNNDFQFSFHPKINENSIKIDNSKYLRNNSGNLLIRNNYIQEIKEKSVHEVYELENNDILENNNNFNKSTLNKDENNNIIET